MVRRELQLAGSRQASYSSDRLQIGEGGFVPIPSLRHPRQDRSSSPVSPLVDYAVELRLTSSSPESTPRSLSDYVLLSRSRTSYLTTFATASSTRISLTIGRPSYARAVSVRFISLNCRISSSSASRRKILVSPCALHPTEFTDEHVQSSNGASLRSSTPTTQKTCPSRATSSSRTSRDSSSICVSTTSTSLLVPHLTYALICRRLQEARRLWRSVPCPSLRALHLHQQDRLRVRSQDQDIP